MATERRAKRSTGRNSRTQQKPTRRGRILLLTVGLLLVVGSVGTWVAALVTDPARLPLHTIRITGELAHLDRARLQQLVADAIDGGFFAVDMTKLRDAAQQLAWVDTVSIRRVWPQTLVMDVTEQVPVARWGERALVNGRGEIFAPEIGELPAGLPRFEAADEHAPLLVDFYHRAGDQLDAIGLHIRALGLRGRHDWRLELDNGMTVLLSQGDAAPALKQFIAALPVMRDPQGRRPQRIDMRYENGFAVHWAPAAEPKSNQRGDA